MSMTFCCVKSHTYVRLFVGFAFPWDDCPNDCAYTRCCMCIYTIICAYVRNKMCTPGCVRACLVDIYLHMYELCLQMCTRVRMFTCDRIVSAYIYVCVNWWTHAWLYVHVYNVFVRVFIHMDVVVYDCIRLCLCMIGPSCAQSSCARACISSSTCVRALFGYIPYMIISKNKALFWEMDLQILLFIIR